MRARFTLMVAAAAAASFGLVACGGDEKQGGSGGGAGGTALTVYSSLPLQGPSRPQSADVINGEKLALEQKGGKVGKFTIKYVSLDDATAAAGKWEAGQTSANARKAAQDDSAICYLGEFNSGASAISIPITNEANLLQISPSNTAIGLTKGGAGADKGEPTKYYPTGQRNYARVVPSDIVQGGAQASLMEGEGVKSVYVLDDNEVYGVGVAKNTEDAAKKLGIQIAGADSIDPKAANYRSLAASIKSSGADAVFFGGIIDNNAVQLWKDLNASLPDAKLFGPDGVATVDFAKGIPEAAQKQTFLTAPTLSPEDYPPEGQKFYEDYAKKYGEKADEIDPYALYGYEAMNLCLSTIERAGEKGNDKAAVIEQVYQTKGLKSALGTYDIDKDGDTTLTDYGAYRAVGGKLVFDKVVKAAI